MNRLIPFSSAVALSVGTAFGTVLYRQDFESLTPGPLAGQDGFTAMAQAQVAAGGLSYENGDVAIDGGGQCVSFTGLTPANNWVFSREFPEQTGTVYFSLLMTWTAQSVDDMLYFALSDDADTTPCALGNSAGININRNGTVQDGMVCARIRGNSSGETTSNSSGKAGGQNTPSPQFIVGCVEKSGSGNYNRMRLWVNPTAYAQGTEDVSTSRDLKISAIDTFYYFSGSANESNEAMKVDNIRIGTTWEDVLPPLQHRNGTVISFRSDPPPPAWHEIAADGAYCWFADPRALRFRSADGAAERTFLGWVDRAGGDIRALQYDHNTDTSTTVVIAAGFERDDHDNPTFLVLPDERIMVFWSRHSNEKKIWYRVSTEPGDLTTLGPTRSLDTDHTVTYPTPFLLADDPEHLYLVWRGIEWHPTLARLALPSAANGHTTAFDGGPWQIVRSAAEKSGTCRPYAKYASDGTNRLYLAYSATHPDNLCPTMLYGGYVDIRDLSLHALDGTVLDADLASGEPFTVRNNETFAAAPGWLLANDADIRHWVWQTALGGDGAFHVLFTKISRDKTHHEYWYGLWADGVWRVLKLADAGSWFHQNPSTEKCYSAGLAFDSADPCIVYVSVPVNGVYEIHRLTVAPDASRILSDEAVTTGSDKNNIRPFGVVGSRPSDGLRLFWMHGDYYYWRVSNPANADDGYLTGIRTDRLAP